LSAATYLAAQPCPTLTQTNL